jgi:hypothetical protein
VVDSMHKPNSARARPSAPADHGGALIKRRDHGAPDVVLVRARERRSLPGRWINHWLLRRDRPDCDGGTYLRRTVQRADGNAWALAR